MHDILLNEIMHIIIIKKMNTNNLQNVLSGFCISSIFNIIFLITTNKIY